MQNINQHIKTENRKEAIKQGFYDGRFAPKVNKDKKKHASKFGIRRNKFIMLAD